MTASIFDDTENRWHPNRLREHGMEHFVELIQTLGMMCVAMQVRRTGRELESPAQLRYTYAEILASLDENAANDMLQIVLSEAMSFVDSYNAASPLSN